MKVIHEFHKLKAEKNIDEDVGFMMTNKKGGYCNFFNFPSSRYQGFFYFDTEKMDMFKIIENIELIKKGDVESLTNNFYFTDRNRKKISEKFWMPNEENSMIYQLNKEAEIDLVLDCKRSYDAREWGRNYLMFEEDEFLIIEFTKKKDSREDSSDGDVEFKLFIAVKGHDKFKKNGSWIERSYSYDRKRGTRPFRRYVYHACRLRGKKFVFSVAKTKEDAKRECGHITKKMEHYKRKEMEHFVSLYLKMRRMLAGKKISNEVKLAYMNAVNSLNSLIVLDNKNLGLLAGLPWFFQYWSRDALVSMHALTKINDKIAGKLIFKYMKSLNSDGRLPNIAGSRDDDSVRSSDANGWLFVRCADITDGIHADKYLYSKDMKKKKVLSFIENKLQNSVEKLLEKHTHDHLESSQARETWMDTIFDRDNREGFRIEMQAFRLNMYSLMLKISGNEKYQILENLMKEKVIEKFWNGKVLADGAGDFTIRPNVFIAAYAYPELLSHEQWETCLGTALEKLWLDWGGISSIDKDNGLFSDEYTGENVKSYHRGDSWFWINNLAALVMHRVNKEKFRTMINQIIRASTEEILWKGCVGCHAELSSAKELRSEGCWNQAWSNAMYIEMIDEVFR